MINIFNRVRTIQGHCILVWMILGMGSSYAQNESALSPIIIESDSGEAGSGFSVMQNNDITYLLVQTDYINLGNPGSANRIASYEVTLPDTGKYNLFVRLRVGANKYNDDSFFYGNGFGKKDSTNDNDWITVNGLQTAGYSGPGDVVNEPGGLGEGVWKWVNLSKNGYQGEGGITFTVEKDSLTKTFQIGGRENGLEIDKFAFGRSDLYFTVDNLDKVEPGTTEFPGDVWEGPPLASRQRKFLGSAYSPNQAPNFESYWNQVTPEDAGKWVSVEGNRDVMNWGGLDAAYNFAKTNHFLFRYHVLVWGNQQPTWIETMVDSPAVQLEKIKEWFGAVAEHLPAIDYVEVVNEPLHDPPTAGSGNYIGALGGSGVTGWDWVLNAFRIARQSFPSTTKLMLNEYNILNSSNNTSQYLNIIRLLQAENLIDAIGVQGHAFSTTGSVAVMKSSLDALASTGLPIQVTEMDIDGATDEVQLQDYKRIFPTLYAHPGVIGITLWGWKPGLWRNAQGAYLIQQSGAERPALKWLRDYLDTLTITSVEVANGAPQRLKLFDNFPNPFNPTTNIRYAIAKTSKVVLKVFDVLGRDVQTLVNDEQSPGEYTTRFNAQNLASGIYFYRLEAGNFISSKKLILVK